MRSLKRHSWVKSCALIVTLLVSQILWIRAPVHSTAKSVSAPVEPSTSGLAPFLDVVPSQDGTELFISASGVGELSGAVFVNVGVGPGHDKDSWTMTYSSTVQSYVATATGFTPHTGASGPLNITTTQGLDTGVVDFNRAYVPASSVETVSSIDGNLDLSIVNTDTLPSETYIAIVPSYAPPGPAPAGHRFVGSVYSVRAAGALLTSDKPMSLRMYYEDDLLHSADPHTLSIFAWHAYEKRWKELGGRLFSAQRYLSATTSRFTTYALMTTPSWRDDFDDFGSLDETDNVALGGAVEERTLVLSETPGEGVAVSRVVTPTGDFARWGAIFFTGDVDPPTTTLAVDVLSADGNLVLTNVASGIDLVTLNPAQHPTLRLRARLSSTMGEETPALETWQLSWQVKEYRIYLAVVLR